MVKDILLTILPVLAFVWGLKIGRGEKLVLPEIKLPVKRPPTKIFHRRELSDEQAQFNKLEEKLSK